MPHAQCLTWTFSYLWTRGSRTHWNSGSQGMAWQHLNSGRSQSIVPHLGVDRARRQLQQGLANFVLWVTCRAAPQSLLWHLCVLATSVYSWTGRVMAEYQLAVPRFFGRCVEGILLCCHKLKLYFINLDVFSWLIIIWSGGRQKRRRGVDNKIYVSLDSTACNSD